MSLGRTLANCWITYLGDQLIFTTQHPEEIPSILLLLLQHTDASKKALQDVRWRVDKWLESWQVRTLLDDALPGPTNSLSFLYLDPALLGQMACKSNSSCSYSLNKQLEALARDQSHQHFKFSKASRLAWS